jgi:TRAP-type C4-dicarboxylate transport system substrate-binding protein
MQKIHHFFTIPIVSLFILNVSSVTATNAAPILMRFSHVVEENTPKGRGAKMIQDLVEECLSGRVMVEIYPDSQISISSPPVTWRGSYGKTQCADLAPI